MRVKFFNLRFSIPLHTTMELYFFTLLAIIQFPETNNNLRRIEKRGILQKGHVFSQTSQSLLSTIEFNASSTKIFLASPSW